MWEAGWLGMGYRPAPILVIGGIMLDFEPHRRKAGAAGTVAYTLYCRSVQSRI